MRLCPVCNEGCMRPISEIKEDLDESRRHTKFYECDNEYCKYRSAQTGINKDARLGEESDEPTMCSKCNIIFNISQNIHTIMIKSINHYEITSIKGILIRGTIKISII